MQENSYFSLVNHDDDETEYYKSMRELRNFSSQLYHAADYCEKTFLKAQDKTTVLETTKAYISRAVITVVDHIGNISANLDSCISKTNSVSHAQHKIDILKLRISASHQLSDKFALARFYWSADFSRHHCRYILPPTTNVISRDIKIGEEDRFETEEPLFLHTYNCKPFLAHMSTKDIHKNHEFSPPVLPVRDGLSILPKAEQSAFKFEEGEKVKRSMMNCKVMQKKKKKKKKDITSLVRRGKRILAQL